MKSTQTKIGIAFFLMLGLAALFLLRIQSFQRLGEPGVKVGNEPIFNENGLKVGNESVHLPADVPGYVSEPAQVQMIELNMLPPDTVYGRRLYKGKDAFQAAVSVVLMGSDRTSIHKPQYCLVGSGWQIEKSEVETVRVSRPSPYDLKVMKLTLTTIVPNPDRKPVTYKGLFVYWFVAPGQLTPHHGQRMWWMAKDLLVKNLLQRWAYVAYFSTCLPGQENALYERMKDFIDQTVPEFQLTSGANSGVSLSMATPESMDEVAGGLN